VLNCLTVTFRKRYHGLNITTTFIFTCCKGAKFVNPATPYTECSAYMLNIGMLFYEKFWFKKMPYQYVSNYMLIIVQRDASQSSLFIILQAHSTCFRCQPHLSSGVHKTVTTASGTGHIFVQRVQASLATLEGGSCTKNMTSIRGCSYSFVYSWWWMWLTPEICRMSLQNNK